MYLDTDRLQLRALDELTAMAIARSERPISGWAVDYPTEPDARIARLLIDRVIIAATEERPWGPFLIVDRDDELVVGGIGFKGAPNDDGAVEVGYGVCPSYRGKGVATEALGALVRLAYDRGVDAVIADTEVDNVASQRVLAKAGFTNVATRDELLLWRHPGPNDVAARVLG